ncbi:unnamed protein product [Rotaria sordida]|uniref:Uncharacterized protein n=1 Tax=Rotaria sordida TaxID=392033 RepID=A0A815TPW9_9BILA|nr:unnamed protein product [Rotaria sordida]
MLLNSNNLKEDNDMMHEEYGERKNGNSRNDEFDDEMMDGNKSNENDSNSSCEDFDDKYDDNKSNENDTNSSCEDSDDKHDDNKSNENHSNSSCEDFDDKHDDNKSNENDSNSSCEDSDDKHDDQIMNNNEFDGNDSRHSYAGSDDESNTVSIGNKSTGARRSSLKLSVGVAIASKSQCCVCSIKLIPPTVTVKKEDRNNMFVKLTPSAAADVIIARMNSLRTKSNALQTRLIDHQLTRNSI